MARNQTVFPEHPSSLTASRADNATRCGLYRLLQLLGRPERDLLAGFDLDDLASRRISAHSSRAVLDLEDAKAGQANFVTVLEMPGGKRHQGA